VLGGEGEELEADAGDTLLLLEVVADVEAEVATGGEHARALGEDLAHLDVEARIVGRELADAARVVGVVDVIAIRRVDEHEARTATLDWQLARVGRLDVRPERLHVEAASPAPGVLADIERRARATHRVDHEITLARVALDEVPRDVRGSRADVARVSLHPLSVVLRGIVPERRRLDAHRRALEVLAPRGRTDGWALHGGATVHHGGRAIVKRRAGEGRCCNRVAIE
jgi:hypothetical protein